jgi:hypothetical protein
MQSHAPGPASTFLVERCESRFFCEERIYLAGPCFWTNKQGCGIIWLDAKASGISMKGVGPFTGGSLHGTKPSRRFPGSFLFTPAMIAILALLAISCFRNAPRSLIREPNSGTAHKSLSEACEELWMLEKSAMRPQVPLMFPCAFLHHLIIKGVII